MNRRVIDRIERAVSAALNGMPAAPGDCILVAVSGGPDSVALTHALHRLCSTGRDLPRHRLIAAHLNHRLRGDESDRDERFVRELCERLQIDLVVERVGREKHLTASSNLEERARDLRYAFLNRTADRIGARYIAVAHHADDQAETVMLRLLRGSGVAGLAAMDAMGPGRIVRPLLTLRREEVVAYLKAIEATYVIDSSNLSAAILRNRIRRELIPTLERDYAPRLSRRLSALAREMRALDDYISSEGRRELHRRLHAPNRLDLAGFADFHPALSGAIVREWLRQHHGDLRRVYRAEIERIGRFCVTAAPGSIARLARGWRLRCEYGFAVLEPIPATALAPLAVELGREGVTEAGEAGVIFVAQLFRRGDEGFRSRLPNIGARQMEALFDADKVEGSIIVRNFRKGDRVRPLGMPGTCKVHDVFVNRKLPRERRATWPIVESGSEILWIPGLSRSRVALVTEATDEVLQLRAKPRVSMGDESLLGN
jgi:tRNA(Ile)-lysidine synthase